MSTSNKIYRGQLAGKSEQLGRASHFPWCESAHRLDVFTIDPLATQSLDHLGPANAEQRAEIRKSWRTWFWGIARMYLTAIAVVATFGTVGVICMLLGAANSEVVLETFSEVLR